MISDLEFNNANLLARIYSEEIVFVGLNKVDQNNYSEAIEDFTKAMDKYVYENIIRFKTVKNEEIKSIGVL